MSDLTNLDGVSGELLTEPQIRAILAQIDLDVMNLMRDGKLAALKYKVPGETGRDTDRAANLNALLQARAVYQTLLDQIPSLEFSQATCCEEPPS